MPAGRRRSEVSRRAIIDATRTLLMEVGYERLTTDAIAARAGVGKQTVYRWWSSKGAVVAEAAIDGGLVPDYAAVSITDDLASDLREWMRGWLANLTTPLGTSMTLALMAASSSDQRISDQLYASFTLPVEQLLWDRLELARIRGEIRSDTDVRLVAGAMIGSLLYRILERQHPPTDRDVDWLVGMLVAGIGRRGEA